MDLHNATLPTVLIAHPEALTVAGIMYALQRDANLRVVEAESLLDAPDSDIVITNQLNGLRLALAWRALRLSQAKKACQLVVVGSQAREFEIRQALEAGIRGYVLASCPTEELVRCVHMLMHGSRYFSTAVAQTIADGMGREALTPRESDVLDLLVDGHCNKAIAQSLAIAVGTVKAHVKAILEKLGARSRTHAVVVAAARGLILDAPDPEERIKLRRGHYSRNPMTSAAKSSGY